jgi:hypothetical protein
MANNFIDKIKMPDGRTLLMTGVPTGGKEGQILAKKSDTDIDLVWQDPKAVGYTAGEGVIIEDGVIKVSPITVDLNLEIGDIGISALGIDESIGTRKYLNGQRLMQKDFPIFTDKVKNAVRKYPHLACTNDEWEATATLSHHGQCGKFVIDDELEQIRLPRIITPIQGVYDIISLGSIQEAGLPNITGKLNDISSTSRSVTEGTSSEGSINWEDNMVATTTGGAGTRYGAGVTIDASLSSEIYGNSNTVQQEAIMYPYYIQVANGGVTTSTDITREVELNNPFSLFDIKTAVVPINNASWLKGGDGVWHSGELYVSAYEELLRLADPLYTDSLVCYSTEQYNDYNIVVDVQNKTFRLPIKMRNRMLIGKMEADSGDIGKRWYNLYSDGYLEQGGRYTGTMATSYSATILLVKPYRDVHYNISISSAGLNNDKLGEHGENIENVTTTSFTYFYYTSASADGTNGFYWSTKGYVSELTLNDFKLFTPYYYVGETTQNANLINLSALETTLTTKIVGKQEKLTAGEGIVISEDFVISAEGEKYTAGEGITISEDNVINIDATKVPNLKLTVGEVTTLPAGEEASVEIIPTENLNEFALNLSIPKGDRGTAGADAGVSMTYAPESKRLVVDIAEYVDGVSERLAEINGED